jgi:hypothetical protein
LLLNGRTKNLEYRSYAPGAPNILIEDSQFKDLWMTPERYYLFAKQSTLPQLGILVGSARLFIVEESGGKLLLTNEPVPGSVQLDGATTENAEPNIRVHSSPKAASGDLNRRLPGQFMRQLDSAGSFWKESADGLES